METLSNIDFSEYIKEKTEGFTGRDWILTTIDKWLINRETNRIFLLTGGPGSGKTAIAAKVVQTRLEYVHPDAYTQYWKNSIAYFHFCQAQLDVTVNPLRFVESLSAAFANRYQVFAEALLKIDHREIKIDLVQNIGTLTHGSVTGIVINSLHIGNLSARAAFDLVFRRPLEMLCIPTFHEIITILIDSLDEAFSYSTEENIPQLLVDAITSVQNLPVNLRFLLTSRRDPRIISMLGEPTLELIDDAPVNIDDVCVYAKQRLGDIPTSANIAKKIALTSKGNFLYARYVLDELEKHPEVLANPAVLLLPDGLDEIYRKFIWRELGRNRERWDERYMPILGLLAVTRGQGLTRSQLTAVAEQYYDLHESRANEALDSCIQYLVGQQPDGPFNIYHKSFREFLIKDENYKVFPVEANQALGTFFMDEYENNWLACCENYALEHTATHLLYALRGTTRQQSRNKLTIKLVSLLSHFDYLEVKTWKLGVNSILTDLKGAVSSISIEEKEIGSLLYALLNAISNEAVNLMNWDRLKNTVFFAQQVHNRAVLLGLPNLAKEAAIQLERLKRSYLKVIWYSPFGKISQLPLSQGRVDLLQARILTKFGQWPIRVPGIGDSTLEAYITKSPTSSKIKLSTSYGIQDFTFHREGSLKEDTQEINLEYSIPRVLPGGHFIGIKIGKVILWDTNDFIRDWAPYITQGLVIDIPDHEWVIATLKDGSLRLISAKTGNEEKILFGHSTTITSLAATADGHQLISGSVDGIIIIWDLENTTTPKKLVGHNGPITALVIRQIEKQIISASIDGTLMIWDLKSGANKYTLRGHNDAILKLVLVNHGRKAISASADGTLKVWNLATKQEEFTFFGHNEAVISLAITPNERYAISASSDGTLKVWDLDTRLLKYDLLGHSGPVHTLAVSQDCEHCLSASQDGSLRLWNLTTGCDIKRFDFEPFSMIMLPRDKYIVTNQWWSNILEIWNVSVSDEANPDVFCIFDHDLGHLIYSSESDTILSGDETGAVYCLRFVEGKPEPNM